MKYFSFYSPKKSTTQNSEFAIRQKYKSEEEVRQREIRIIELQQHIGNLVICISNEIANPTVAIGESIMSITQGDVPMLVVKDVVTGESKLPFGIVMAYTEQKFDALNSMDPNARIALFYYKDSRRIVENKPSEDMMPSEEWAKVVKEAVLQQETINSNKRNHKP